MSCYCHTCKKDFHPLGIMRHRAMHRDKYQDCEITFTHGDRRRWEYSKRAPKINRIEGGK